MTNSPFALFLIFLRLGCTSFGGPVAHLGYFREEFVVRRAWLTEAAYANLVALAQFVPGPASSQASFAIGLSRSGPFGGIASWAGFTLPSALLMFAAAFGLNALKGPYVEGAIHGLKLLAVAVVTGAVWGMAKSFCAGKARAGLSFAIAAVLIAAPSYALQLGAIAVGFALGVAFIPAPKDAEPHFIDHTTQAPGARAALVLFFVLLAGLPALADATASGAVAVASAFYQAGALVFGGGHVVLPLLQETVVAPGWISTHDFLAGYGAAQALPGPLFSIAIFLGAKSSVGPAGALGGALALIAMSLPGLLIFYGALAYWAKLQDFTFARRGIAGVNAAVVGILGAALYSPVWTSSIERPLDASIAVIAFAALTVWRFPLLLVAALTALAGAAQRLIG